MHSINPSIISFKIKKSLIPPAGAASLGGGIACALFIIGILALLASQGVSLPGAFSSLAALKLAGALVFTIAGPMVAITSILFFLSMACKINKARLFNRTPSQANRSLSTPSTKEIESSEKVEKPPSNKISEKGSHVSSKAEESEPSEKAEKSSSNTISEKVSSVSSKSEEEEEDVERVLVDTPDAEMNRLINELDITSKEDLLPFIKELTNALTSICATPSNEPNKIIATNFFIFIIRSPKLIRVELRLRNIEEKTNEDGKKGIFLIFNAVESLFLPNWTQDNIISLINKSIVQFIPRATIQNATFNGLEIQFSEEENK